jgi:hypothetical protein
MEGTTNAAVVDGGKQGLGGREASGEPASSAAKAVNAPKGEGKYARGTEDGSSKIMAARQLHGRPTLAEHLGRNQSTIWRWERSKVQVGEVEAFNAAVAKLPTLPQPEPKGTGTGSKVKRAVALLDQAADDSKFGKAKLIDELRAILA